MNDETPASITAGCLRDVILTALLIVGIIALVGAIAPIMVLQP